MCHGERNVSRIVILNISISLDHHQIDEYITKKKLRKLKVTYVNKPTYYKVQ